jgi:hypothetical protein
MFIVKWIVQDQGASPVRTEKSPLTDLDEAFAHCQGRLLGGATKSMESSPDGFIICDLEGNVLRRWLGKVPRLD